METFKNHRENIKGVFRRSHTNVQNVAVVERDFFEELDELIKVFRHCNRLDISKLHTTNVEGAKKFLNLTELLSLVKVKSMAEHRFSLN